MMSLVPPTGGTISLGKVIGDPNPSVEAMHFYESGTAALAAALRWAADLRPNGTEVLLPAYGCPSLVSAVLHVGLRPVLVDLAIDSPFPAAEELSRLSTARTVACLHVNFLGFQPPAPNSGGGCLSRGLHIYDSCQAWPEGGQCSPWADVTIVSFGRGKPISLAGGGGLIPNERHGDHIPYSPSTVSRSALVFRLRAALHNLALRPRVYWWVDRLPWLGIGETHFRQLREIGGMSDHARKLVPANIVSYLRARGWSLLRLRKYLETRRLKRFSLPTGLAGDFEGARLLRLPLLAESKVVRDRSIQILRGAGYSATVMYGAPLWSFSGLEALLEFEQACPNAARFADRLLTLPTHDAVDGAAMDSMLKCLEGL